MKRLLITSSSLLLAFLFLVASAPTTSAQSRYNYPQYRQDNRWDNDGYRGYRRTSLAQMIARVENRSNTFVRVFDRALDSSRFEGTFREDRLNFRAAELEQSVNRLERTFNATRDYNAVRYELQRTMNIAQGISTVMRRRNLDPVAERQWALLRQDLNTLARAFNVRQV